MTKNMIAVLGALAGFAAAAAVHAETVTVNGSARYAAHGGGLHEGQSEHHRDDLWYRIGQRH